jgi:hypothetical protein
VHTRVGFRAASLGDPAEVIVGAGDRRDVGIGGRRFEELLQRAFTTALAFCSAISSVLASAYLAS